MRNRKNLPRRPVRRPATVGLARPNNKIAVVSAPICMFLGSRIRIRIRLSQYGTDQDLTFSHKSIERTEIMVAK
jgi:hypothetical protein